MDGRTPAENDILVRVRSARLRGLYASLPSALAVGLVNAGVLAAVLWPQVAPERLGAWLGAVVLLTLLRLVRLGGAVRALEGADTASLHQSERRFVIHTVISGAIWGSVSVLAFPAESIPHQTFMAFILGGLSAGAVTTLPYFQRPVQLFLLLTMAPLCMRLALTGESLGIIMGGMLSLFLVMLLVTLRRMHAGVMETIRLQVENTVQAEALDTSRQRLELHHRNTPLGVIEWDTNGRAVAWNPGAERIFGFTRAEMIGQTWERLIPESARPQVAEVARALLAQQGGQRSTNANVTRDGRPIRCEWYNTPLVDEHGRVFGIASLVEDVTERQLSEIALRESEERFRQVVENAGDAFFLHDPEGHFVDVNGQACAGLGYSREELLSMHVSQVEVGADPEALAELWPRMEKGETVTIQGQHRRKNGDTFPVEVRLSMLERKGHKLLVALARDVSERLAAQEAIRANEERLRFLLGEAPVVIYTCSLEENYPATYISPNIRQLMGFSPETFLADPGFWASGIHPEDRERVFRELGGLFEHGTHEHEYRFRKPDGSYVWVHDEMRLVHDPEGRPLEIIGYWADVSRRKEVEFALVEARREAEHASQAKSRFLSRMSHELRTPLNGILGFAQLLEMDEEALNDSQRDGVKHILSGGNHLLNLINDLLDLSKLDIGELSLSLEPVPLDDALASCRRLVEPMAKRREVHVHGATGGGLWVQADHVRLKQVLLNLLSNAVKYNRVGGEVEIGVEASGGRVRILVRDTGPGIDPSFRDELFEPFRRALPTEELVEGTGIGLSISRKLMERMAGEIGFESPPGRGSTFWVDLPAAGRHELDDARPVIISRQGMPDLQMPLTVLQVEDNPSNRQLMQEILAKVPHVTLHSAVNGEDGIAMARDVNPGLVLLDMNLPDMTGFDVYRRIREHADLKTVPVVAVSADSMPDQVERALNTGFDAYLCKPYQVRGVLEVIERVSAARLAASSPE